MRPQKAQMAQKDDLDQAIDRVAAQLTRVDESPEFAARIMASLPERVTWFGWVSHSLAPRLAMIAIAAGAATLWMNREQAPSAIPELTAAPLTVAASYRSPLEPAALWNQRRTMPLERLEPLELLEPQSKLDHERSLASVAAPKEIGLEALSPTELPGEASIEIAPLAISDLPLSSGFPQRD